MPNTNPDLPRPLLIAVVDDHEPCRSSICRVLQHHGFDTRDFSSVAEFIHSNAKLVIDCLVLDVGMPGIDGVSFHECLQHTNFQFPVIFCTGLEMDARLQNALTNGAFAVLKKPVGSEALIEAVRSACAAPQAKKTR